MSMSGDKNQLPRQSPLFPSSKKLSRSARRKKLVTECASLKNPSGFGGLMTMSFCGSGIHNLMNSFEPCEEYYKSKGLSSSSSSSLSIFGQNGFSLFGLKSSNSLNRVAQNGKTMAVDVHPAKETSTKKKPLTKKRRVVVTGLGVVSPVGHDADFFYDNLLAGVSGISEIEAFDCAQFPTKIAGEIKSFSTDGWVAPKLSKRADKFMLYLLTAGWKMVV